MGSYFTLFQMNIPLLEVLKKIFIYNIFILIYFSSKVESLTSAFDSSVRYSLVSTSSLPFAGGI